jgi:hypothetical protein
MRRGEAHFPLSCPSRLALQQVTSRTKSLNKHVLGAPPAAQVGVSAPRGKRPASHCVPLVPDRPPQAAADLPGGSFHLGAKQSES